MNETAMKVPLSRKAVSWIVTFAMTLLLMPALSGIVPQQAQAAEGEWTGSGTEADPYIIIDAAGLQKLARSVGTYDEDWNYITYAGTYFKLGADIDLDDIEKWQPIGTNTGSNANMAFAGTFDGDGHTISNMHCYSTFVNAGGNTANTYTCALFGQASGTLKNFVVTGSVDARMSYNTYQGYGNYPAAGVVAYGFQGLVMENIGNEVDVISDNGYLAGLVGTAVGSVTITGCYNKGTISMVKLGNGNWAGPRMGGIIGYHRNMKHTITACYNAGDIVYDGTYEWYGANNCQAGIMAGAPSNTSRYPVINGVYNSGAIYHGTSMYTAEDFQPYGAILGCWYGNRTMETTNGVYYVKGKLFSGSGEGATALADQAVGYESLPAPVLENTTAVSESEMKSAEVIATMNAACPEVNGGKAFKFDAGYPLLYWEPQGEPVITTQPQSFDVTLGNPATTLSVEATTPDEGIPGHGGTLSYQWYKYAYGAAETTAELVEGATANTYTPDVSQLGATYCYCVITNNFTLDGAEIKSSTKSAPALVNVQDSNAASTPVVAMELEETVTQAADVSASVTVSGLTYTDGMLDYTLVQKVDGEEVYATSGTAEVSEGGATFTVPTNTFPLGVNETTITVTNTYELTKKVSSSATKSMTVVSYKINNPEELVDFANKVTAGDNFKGRTVELMADLDLSTLPEDKPFNGIGTFNRGFVGEFDGHGHTVANMNLNGDQAVGFFNHISATQDEPAFIHDFEVSGSVSGRVQVGGAVGFGQWLKVARVANHADVTSTGNNSGSAGGIVGYFQGYQNNETYPVSSIESCYNDGRITADLKTTWQGVGGIVGHCQFLIVSDCYNLGTIQNVDTTERQGSATGGIMGYESRGIGSGEGNPNSYITNCYNAGRVIPHRGATDYYGAVIGYTVNNYKMTDSRTNPLVDNVFYLEGTSSRPASNDRSNGIDNYYNDLFAELIPAVDSATLVGKAKALGKEWKPSPASHHDGYPSLRWEKFAGQPVVTFKVAEPVEGMHVSVEAEGRTFEALPQQDGTQTLSLAAGSYTATATAYGYDSQTVEFTVADQDMDVNIPAFVKASNQNVTFAISKGGEAVTDAAVVVKNSDGTEIEAVEGVYSVPAGVYSYTVDAAGCLVKNGEFTVEAAPLEVPIELEDIPAVWDGEFAYKPRVDADGVYQIGFAAELAWFAEKFNAGKLGDSVKAVLTQDIDLGGKNWTAIGTNGTPFLGSFDGQGHAIRNFLAEKSNVLGLFGYVGQNGKDATTVQNVVVAGKIDAGAAVAAAGGIAANLSNGKILRCGSAVDIVNITDNMTGVGGIVGCINYAQNASSIEECSFRGAIDGVYENFYYRGSHAGGIIGRSQSNGGLSIESCYAEVAFGSHYNYVGGLVGYASAQTEVVDTYANVTVKKPNEAANDGFVGNIVYEKGQLTCDNCYYVTAGNTEGGAAVADAAVELEGVTALESATELTPDMLVPEAFKADRVFLTSNGPILKWENKTGEPLALSDEKLAFSVADMNPGDTTATWTLAYDGVELPMDDTQATARFYADEACGQELDADALSDGTVYAKLFAVEGGDFTGESAVATFTRSSNAASPEAKAALKQAATAAETEAEGYVASEDGTDVPSAKQWVPAETMQALEEAIAKAKTLADADNASEGDVAAANANLAKALKAVQDAAKAGTKEASDQAAADAVIAKIDALPAAANITAADEDAVDEAEDAFEALTDDQKALVSDEAKAALAAAVTAAEKAVEAAEADAQAAEKALKEAQDAAQAAEKAAQDAAKSQSAEDAAKAVAAAEKAKQAADAAVAAAEKAIASAGSDEAKAELQQVLENAKKAQDQAAKAQQSAEAAKAAADKKAADQAKDEAAKKAAADKKAAGAVDKAISALPALDDVTDADAAAIAKACKAYDKLTPAQKKLVPAAKVKALKAAEKEAKSTLTVNVKKVTKKAVAKALKKSKKKAGSVKKLVLGKKVKKVAKKAFKSLKKTKTLVVKTKKLKKKSAKGCLKGSKVKTVKVKVGSKKVNKKYVKKYKKIFTKKVAGKKAKVK